MKRQHVYAAGFVFLAVAFTYLASRPEETGDQLYTVMAIGNLVFAWYALKNPSLVGGSE